MLSRRSEVSPRSLGAPATLAAPLGQVAEWQTRTVQVRVSVRTWGFNSPLAHTEFPEDSQESSRATFSRFAAPDRWHRNGSTRVRPPCHPLCDPCSRGRKTSACEPFLRSESLSDSPWSSSMPSLNLGIVAHVDAGKTSLTERLLYEAGVIDTLGSVDEGTTRTDSMDLERRRGITIRAAVTSFALGDLEINLLDTPGHPDFIAEVERSPTVLDAAVRVRSEER